MNRPQLGKVLGWLFGLLFLGAVTIGWSFHMTFPGWNSSEVFSIKFFATAAVIIVVLTALWRLSKKPADRGAIAITAIFVLAYTIFMVLGAIDQVIGEDARHAQALRDKADGKFMAGLFDSPSPRWFRTIMFACALAPLAIWINAFVVYWRQSPVTAPDYNVPPSPPRPVAQPAESSVKVRCRDCRTLNAESAKFCGECGAAL